MNPSELKVKEIIDIFKTLPDDEKPQWAMAIIAHIALETEKIPYRAVGLIECAKTDFYTTCDDLPIGVPDSFEGLQN